MITFGEGAADNPDTIGVFLHHHPVGLIFLKPKKDPTRPLLALGVGQALTASELRVIADKMEKPQ